MAFFGSSWREDDEDNGYGGSMFGPKMGSWWVTSNQDSRWNSSGRGYGLVTLGGPSDAHTWIEECERKYGARPSDLELGFMKD